jgi:hypothetical protein
MILFPKFRADFSVLALTRRTYHAAEVSIYEPSLHRALFPANLNPLRLDMMYSCLLSAKALLEHLLTIPMTSYYGLSIIGLSQLGYGLSTMTKLSLIEVPGWDNAHVRSVESSPSSVFSPTRYRPMLL